MIAFAAIGVIILVAFAVFTLPGRAEPPPAPQPEDDEAELRALLATMPEGKRFAEQPGPLPAVVAAIARDALRTAKSGLPTAMQDVDGTSPWADHTIDYRKRMELLGKQMGEQ